MIRSKFKTLFLAVCVTMMALSMIVLPEESFEASIRGLNMWWEIVFPSLFPFFVISEMLIGFGVVKFIGVMLEPLMRPLFRVPGVGGFAWAMGLASGNPAGAKLTSRLRQEKQITLIEAERLVAFTNSSSPLFIFGAVAVGFFHNANLGIVLAISHYLGNVLVGIMMRFYGYSPKETFKQGRKKIPIMAALRALHKTRIQDKRPIGKLLGDAVTSSIQTLLMIGGFIILFSVINKLLFVLNITSFLASIIGKVFVILHLPSLLTIPFISGLFEITLGSKLVSQVQESTLLQQSIVTGFILAFGGFSVQAQVASILAQTDIRFKPFFFARIMHGIFASIITLLIWKPVYINWLQHGHFSAPAFSMGRHTKNWWELYTASSIHYGPLITIWALAFYVFILLRQLPSHSSK
ncbi:sporulation integral membrane protein YlbJ [Heyndrickxia acidicola]|uniref:Sporulation integral membrane protein YlbJ n=1 Tax=Heyndrickxia acidicola TaxID=209389 RepID=A0ABU6MFZ3_9BACI|nr:sporulation integral membrane protein YlbJ [Heyndrickxia acidicola]MED1202187.1 sporulation integral membrane protein YlbJ [Heyndrickxia acidicola]